MQLTEETANPEAYLKLYYNFNSLSISAFMDHKNFSLRKRPKLHIIDAYVW